MTHGVILAVKFIILCAATQIVASGSACAHTSDAFAPAWAETQTIDRRHMAGPELRAQSAPTLRDPAQADDATTNAGYRRYVERLRDLDETSSRFKSVYSALTRPEFKTFAANAADLVEPCLKFMSTPTSQKRQRTFAILSMSGLKLELRLKFIRSLTDLLDTNQIRAYELYDALFAKDIRSTAFVLNYRDRRVIALLADIAGRTAQDPQSGLRLQEQIAKVLSGAALLDLAIDWAAQLQQGNPDAAWNDALQVLWLLASDYLLPSELGILIVGLVALLAYTAPRNLRF